MLLPLDEKIERRFVNGLVDLRLTERDKVAHESEKVAPESEKVAPESEKVAPKTPEQRNMPVGQL